MADAYTQFLNLTKPEENSSRDTWGAKHNANMDKLDTWAKATSDLAAVAVSKTATGEQAIASAINVAEFSRFRKGIISDTVVYAGTDIIGNGVIRSVSGALQSYGLGGDTTRGQLTLNQAGNRGIVWDGTQYGLPGGDLYVAGRRALLNGDVDLSPYLNKTNANGETLSGNPLINRTAPEYQMVWGGVQRLGMGVGAGGEFVVRDIDVNDVRFTIGRDGGIYTKQFGDLNGRIEQRASDYANAAATAVGNARVASVALQGSWALNVGVGQYSAGHPGVMTGVGIGSNGLFQNITGRYLYFNTPSRGWVGADSI